MLRTADKRLFIGRGLRDLVTPDVKLGYGDLQPWQLVGGYSHRFDASDVASLTIVSDAVSSWASSINGYTLAQGTSASRPRYTTDNIGGIIIPHFDGSDDYLEGSVGGVNVDDSSTWFAVGIVTSANSLNLSGSSGANYPLNWQVGGGSATMSITASYIAVLMTSSAGFVPVDGTPFCVAIRLNSGALKMWSLGETPETGSGSIGGSGNMRVGADKGDCSSGAVAELVTYSSALSDADVEANILALASKWGL